MLPSFFNRKVGEHLRAPLFVLFSDSFDSNTSVQLFWYCHYINHPWVISGYKETIRRREAC